MLEGFTKLAMLSGAASTANGVSTARRICIIDFVEGPRKRVQLLGGYLRDICAELEPRTWMQQQKGGQRRQEAMRKEIPPVATCSQVLFSKSFRGGS